MSTFNDFMWLGIAHIIPEGMDHILFILGLFLLSPHMKHLFMQVTAFTIAHSLTLALTLLGILVLPARLIHLIISLSIVFVAIENIFSCKVRPSRWMVIFGFGLFHGLSFGGTITDLQLSGGQMAAALLGFNVGLEMGQILVLALAFGITFWCKDRIWFIPWVRNPACMIIALTGVFWTVQWLSIS